MDPPDVEEPSLRTIRRVTPPTVACPTMYRTLRPSTLSSDCSLTWKEALEAFGTLTLWLGHQCTPLTSSRAKATGTVLPRFGRQGAAVSVSIRARLIRSQPTLAAASAAS